MPSRTKRMRPNSRSGSKRRTTMRFKKSTRPPKRNDILKKRRSLKGGSYGATPFPPSFASGNAPVYNPDPSRYAVSVSNQPDIAKGGSKKIQRRQRGGGFQQTFLNNVNSISELAHAGVSGNGILHPPLITDITGLSAFGQSLLYGPHQTTLSNTNPPLA